MSDCEKFADFMLKTLSPEDINILKECEKDSNSTYGIEFHCTVGRYIRNMFHLWELYPDDDDEVSAKIIHILICKVKGENYDS